MKNIIFLLLGLLVLAGCQTTSENPEAQVDTSKVDPKYSVAADRSEFDKLREQIPAEKRQENDEKALMAELMGEIKYAPDQVREKFMNVVRKKRELFNRDMDKARDQFNKDEKKNRDAYFKTL